MRHLWDAALGFAATDTAMSQNCPCSEQTRSKSLFLSRRKHLTLTGITSVPSILHDGAGHEKKWSERQDHMGGIESLTNRHSQVLEILWVYFLATHMKVIGK